MTISPMSMPFPIDQVRVRQCYLPSDIHDPMTFRPRASGIAVNLILQQATQTGWLTKHRPPTFSFLKNIKRRYVVLVDRLLYTFKSTQPDTYREYFELTAQTNAFVTDQVAGALFCIEIKKRGSEESWFLQADDADDMKIWLDRIKRTISYLRTFDATRTITSQTLEEVTTEYEEYSMIAGNHRTSSTSSISEISFPMPPISPISSQFEKKSRTYSLSTTVPPQLPPPTSQPPPIPSYAYI